MLIRPRRDDLQVIGYYVGKVIAGLGLMQLIPLALALVLGEWNDLSALTIGAGVAIGLGRLTEWRLKPDRPLDWSHALVAVALAWLLGAAIVAVPLYLTGHYETFVDAGFDAMSGLTTSGLSLIQDLDHLSLSMNLLRHLTHFAGGQGIVVVVLTMLATSSGNVATLYVAEARDERVVPNIVHTARFIYTVAFVYLVAGTAGLWVATMVAGLTPGPALFHAVNLFMAAFDTGGFAPQSTSIAYYHSVGVEAVTIVLMLAGTLSFGLHYQLWRGRRRDLFEDLETRTLAVTFLLTAGLVTFGLVRAGTFTETGSLFRKGIYTIISAHTGTGFAVNTGPLYVSDWGLIAPAAVVVAMALGGMASSTAGGIKAIRVGLAAKSVARDIRRAVQPDAAVVVASYTHRIRKVITDVQVRSAVTILVLYLLLYLAGGLLGVYFDVPFDAALFESTSAAANVGLTSGVLTPDTPLVMKLFYTFQMWIGRLEFMAVFALVGYGVALVRGKG